MPTYTDRQFMPIQGDLLLHATRRRLFAMPTLLLTVAMVASLAGPASAGSAADRIGPKFFGADLTIGTDTVWPEFAPGVVRVALGWSGIETSPGKYAWSSVDYKVETAEANGARPLLVLQNTPRFHAVGPYSPTLASPPDLGAYRRFAKALVARYGERVDYQVWNEPSVPIFFTGTTGQMARMTKAMGRAARDLSVAAVVAPSFPLRIPSNRRWFERYWASRVKGRPVWRFVDASNISAYPLPNGRPERALAITRWAQKVIDSAGFKGPMWISEVNYGANGLAPTRAIPARLQAAYVVRTYVLTAAAPRVDRVYWWRWEPHQTVNTNLQDGKGNLTRAGRSYGVVQGWLLGSRPRSCKVTRQGIYVCEFRMGDGLRRLVYWKASGKARRVAVPSGAVTKTTTSGKTEAVTPGRKLRVSTSPIMVEVQRSR